MASLDDYRKEIDSLDEKLISLFEKRMNMVLDVAEYKIQNNMEVFQNGRENEVLEKALHNLQNKDYEEEAVKFLSYTMELSRGLQNKLISKQKDNKNTEIKKEEIDKNAKVAFQGVPGAFSEEALLKFFGADCNKESYEEFEDVFEAIDKEEVKYGVLPIENSSTGTITQVLDLIKKYGFYIVAEESIKIDQHLIGIKGTNIKDIKEVYSHTQGIEQSMDYLKKYAWKLIPFHNTATSAKLVKDLKDNTKVAIAGERAASIYGLDIIEKSINTIKDNTTRFIVISKNLSVSRYADKVSVAFSVDNKAGKLYNIIRSFAENNINMIKIESRPMKDEPWRYLFYVAFDGTIDTKEAKNTLKLIRDSSEYFQLLGAYKKVVG